MPDWTRWWSEPWSGLLEYRSYSWIMYWFYFLLGAVCAWTVENWRSWTVRALPCTTAVFIVMYIWLGYDVFARVGRYDEPEYFYLSETEHVY